MIIERGLIVEKLLPKLMHHTFSIQMVYHFIDRQYLILSLLYITFLIRLVLNFNNIVILIPDIFHRYLDIFHHGTVAIKCYIYNIYEPV